MFDKLKNKVGNVYRDTVSKLKTQPIDSKFMEKGILTPEEFEISGDQLIFVSPIWQWQSANTIKLTNNKLPKDKQFLKATIISNSRINDVYNNLDYKVINDEWVVEDNSFEDYNDINSEENTKNLENEEDIANIDSMSSDEEKDNKNIRNIDNEKKENKIKRFYEVYITYDFYYNTPRFWLSGKNYKGALLTNNEIFEDILSEYKDKTVTFEKFPHINIDMASIHPCRHADVIKFLVNEAMNNGEEIKVQQYLFIFLKFISSVMPTLEIDFTTEIKLKK